MIDYVKWGQLKNKSLKNEQFKYNFKIFSFIEKNFEIIVKYSFKLLIL